MRSEHGWSGPERRVLCVRGTVAASYADLGCGSVCGRAQTATPDCCELHIGPMGTERDHSRPMHRANGRSGPERLMLWVRETVAASCADSGCGCVCCKAQTATLDRCKPQISPMDTERGHNRPVRRDHGRSGPGSLMLWVCGGPWRQVVHTCAMATGTARHKQPCRSAATCGSVRWAREGAATDPRAENVADTVQQ